MTRYDYLFIAMLIIAAACCVCIGYMLAPDAVEVIRWQYIPEQAQHFAGVKYWMQIGAC